MPGGSPFAEPGSATPSPPTPLPRDPWSSPSAATAPTPAPTIGARFPDGSGGAGSPSFGSSPFAPPGAPGMPSAPPQYDPREFGRPFGAAGGAPPGLVPPALPGRDTAAPSTPAPTSARTAVLVGVVSAIIASLITGGLFVAFDRSTSAVDANQTTTSQPGSTYLSNSLDIHGLLDRAQPSVVTIRTDTASVNGKQPLGAGSGVIISADGLVLTNAHVIAGASGLKVILFDGTSKTATLVGSLPNDDVALIKIDDPGSLTPAELGTANDLKVGDPVVAIGNALNLGGSPSVTEGIVSAKDRDIQTSEGNLTNLIQTDAAINPGNSGGPLVNASGQVVGINTAIIENSQNIGFAISIDVIKPRIEDLKNGKGTVTPNSAFLGVSTQSVQDVSAAILQKYGVTASEGAFVSDVVVGSSAEEAGLQPGDVITSIDGKTIASAADVGSAIRSKKAGDTVEMAYEREGEAETVTVTLKSRATTGK
jgi:putative serine protease PepD